MIESSLVSLAPFFIVDYCRYPELKLEYILDFEEKFQKPNFPDRAGYQSRRQNAPFIISAEDIRENIKVRCRLVSNLIRPNQVTFRIATITVSLLPVPNVYCTSHGIVSSLW